jgi:CubicO group peptidase (beta-lactamase class C family)
MDLDPDQPVDRLDDETNLLANVESNLWGLMNHTDRLARPSLIEALLTPSSQRDTLVIRALHHRVHGYSEYAASHILNRVVETLAEVPALEYVRSTIIEPLELERGVRVSFSPNESIDSYREVAFGVRGLPGHALPLTYDRSPYFACDDRLTFGGYASAKGLCKLYGALGTAMAGRVVPGIPKPSTLHEMLRHTGPLSFDPVLKRRCNFGGGFMVDLENHGYEGLGPRSFGHSGFNGMSWAGYDPDRQLAFAAIANGTFSLQQDADLFRSTIIDAMVETVGQSIRYK